MPQSSTMGGRGTLSPCPEFKDKEKFLTSQVTAADRMKRPAAELVVRKKKGKTMLRNKLTHKVTLRKANGQGSESPEGSMSSGINV